MRLAASFMSSMKSCAAKRSSSERGSASATRTSRVSAKRAPVCVNCLGAGTTWTASAA
ncbi:MAG: hypothetical protein LC785_00435 [Acidobacteria bacterium]|nr:hypothetical protein [Acidobacteriota bacterium]